MIQPRVPYEPRGQIAHLRRVRDKFVPLEGHDKTHVFDRLKYLRPVVPAGGMAHHPARWRVISISQSCQTCCWSLIDSSLGAEDLFQWCLQDCRRITQVASRFLSTTLHGSWKADNSARMGKPVGCHPFKFSVLKQTLLRGGPRCREWFARLKQVLVHAPVQVLSELAQVHGGGI